MRVRMLRTVMGARDGALHPEKFVEGQEYDLGGDLLAVFLSEGYVEGLAAAHFDSVKAEMPTPKADYGAEPQKAVEVKIGTRRGTRKRG